MKILFSLVLVMIASIAFANRAFKGNYDAQFLDRMIRHHEKGISMAKMAQEKSTNQEVVKLSKQMEEEQTKEVDKMRQWRKDLFSKVPEQNEKHRMKMSDLQNLSGTEFDKSYLSMMSKHHQMGKEMMEKAQFKLSDEKIRNFAKEGAKKQAQEIQDIDQTKSSI